MDQNGAKMDFMTTDILPEKLSISIDWDEDPAKAYPVLLFTPWHYKGKDYHYHIELTNMDGVRRLHEWLGIYLERYASTK